MSNNVLPNLSEWFEVPVGATIPAGTRFVALWSDGSHSAAWDDDPFPVTVADRYFTEKPIEAPKKTLEDVIREAGSSVSDIAKAVEAFYAEQKQPKVIISLAGNKWRLNALGTYDLWRDDHTGVVLQGYTREQIESVYGIKEGRICG